MGLGKTVQVIALVCHQLEARGRGHPFLIAAPASVLANWAAELRRWAPRVKAALYAGGAAERERVWREEVNLPVASPMAPDVVLTSYEFLMAPGDRARLAGRGRKW